MESAVQEWFNAMKMDQAEVAKVDFATTIDKAIKDKNWTRKEFAEAIGASPAWVTKVLRGDVNLTIETMAKLAMAVGWEFSIVINKPIEKTVTVTNKFSSNFMSATQRSGGFEFTLNRSDFSLCNDREYLNAA